MMPGSGFNHRVSLSAISPRRIPVQGQTGFALVMALVFLLVLTILGVSVLNTSTLQTRMAGNSQEATRALEAAESGVERILGDGGIFNTLVYPGDSVGPRSYTYGSTPTAVTITLTEKSKRVPRARKRADINSALEKGMGRFTVDATASTPLGANASVSVGVSKIAP